MIQTDSLTCRRNDISDQKKMNSVSLSPQIVRNTSDVLLRVNSLTLESLGSGLYKHEHGGQPCYEEHRKKTRQVSSDICKKICILEPHLG